jgi:hypothetical protein
MIYTSEDIKQITMLVEELAREVNKEDPIDFGYMPISEDEAWQIMSTQVVANYLQYAEDQIAVEMYLATITKLVVENYVLNAKLLSRK